NFPCKNLKLKKTDTEKFKICITVSRVVVYPALNCYNEENKTRCQATDLPAASYRGGAMNTDRTKKLLLITSSASAEAPLLKQLQQAFPDIRIYFCPAAEGRIPPEAAESLVVFSDPESRTLFMANAQEQLPPRCVTGISLFTPDTLF